MLDKMLAGAAVCALAAAGLAYAAAAPQGGAPGQGAPVSDQDRPGGATAVGGRGADPNLLTRLPTQRQWDSSASAQAFVQKAREIAGNDPDLVFDFNVYCKPSGGSLTTDRAALGVPNSEPRLTPFPAPAEAQPMPPQRLADNLWWFGNTGIGAWLVTSNDGYILFDAMNNEDDAENVIFAGMRKVGLDPAKIKYAVYGHSHLDHTGGAYYVWQKTKARTIMGRDDWTAYYKALAAGAGQATRVKDKTPVPHDIDAADGQEITVGNVTARLYHMPGHTVGSVGMIVPVMYQGRQHPVMFVTAATDVPNRYAFVGGYEHIWDIGIKSKVEAVYQSHPNTNMNMLARTKYVTDNYPPAKNPLIYGAERTAKYLNIMRACTQARMEALGW